VLGPAAFLLALVLPARAQVNAEDIASAASTEGFGLELRFGGGAQTGNLAMLDLRGGLSVQVRDDFDDGARVGRLRERFIVDLRGTYLVLGGSPFLDNRLAHLRYTRMATPAVGIDLFGQYQNNLLVRLRARVTGGVSVAFRPVETARVSLRFGVGPMLEHEQRDVVAGSGDEATVFNPRLVAYQGLRVALVPRRLTLDQVTYVEPRFDDPADLLVVSYSELQATVGERFSMGVTLTVRHDSRPPTGVAATDVVAGWRLRLRFAARTDPNEPH
jgi:hypothetical protein